MQHRGYHGGKQRLPHLLRLVGNALHQLIQRVAGEAERLQYAGGGQTGVFAGGIGGGLAVQLLLAPLHLFTKLPVVHGINAVLGGALGFVKGALLLFFAVWLLRRLQLWITPELISQTYILRFFAEHSPMELITSL